MSDKAERFSPESMIAELRRAGAQIVRPGPCRCPFHEDKHASGSMSQRPDGHWYYHCHTPTCGVSGDVFDLRARLNGSTIASELLVASQDTKPLERSWGILDDLVRSLSGVTDTYRYTNPDTKEVELAVIRLQTASGKRFIQASPKGGRWVMSASPKPWPIYNRGRIKAAARVVVVEGEKAVHALHVHGVVATTSPAGAGKSGFADWSPLAGKSVILWPDNDDAGRKHMAEVRSLLESISPPPTISVLDPADLDLPPKGDSVEFIAACQHPRDELAVLLDGAEPVTGSAEVRSIIEDTISGARRNVVLPWSELARITNMLLPGTVSVICGDPGCAKTFFVLQAFAHMHAQGEKIALFELEGDRAYHSMRVLVQQCGDSHLFSDEWVRENPDKARYYHEQHQRFIDSFSQRITAAPERMINHDDMLAWVKAQCESGHLIIGIDPVTMLEPSDKPWVADQKFVTEAKKIARNYGARLVFVSHPKLGVKGQIRLENVAGGAAYQRFSDTVIWVKKHDKPEDLQIGAGPFGGSQLVSANRTLHISKARNGIGAGWDIACEFSGQTMRFSEYGVVV